jgi:outer membrane protein assembly factor BamD (BamD/ComL family)
MDDGRHDNLIYGRLAMMGSENLKKIAIFLIMTCVLTVLACSGGNGEELYETAQFEELQNNPEHAVKLYQELVRKYPDSEYAGKAEERISVLSKE